ncbi:unnamed protein product [Amoebophrya sp. A120]|nr:unnamed protein product [Amoebophrya sp. A120]|eukprot:GSA120T00013201001.1
MIIYESRFFEHENTNVISMTSSDHDLLLTELKIGPNLLELADWWECEPPLTFEDENRIKFLMDEARDEDWIRYRAAAEERASSLFRKIDLSGATGAKEDYWTQKILAPDDWVPGAVISVDVADDTLVRIRDSIRSAF